MPQTTKAKDKKAMIKLADGESSAVKAQVENILVFAAANYDGDDYDAWAIVESDESTLNSRRTRIKGLTIFDLLLKMRLDDKGGGKGGKGPKSLESESLFETEALRIAKGGGGGGGGGRFIESLLYIGLDATPYSRQISTVKYHTTITTTSQSVVNAIYRSRILCFFKIMYHKFIFLGFDGILQLVQTLLVEYDDEYEGAEKAQAAKAAAKPPTKPDVDDHFVHDSYYWGGSSSGGNYYM